ncbi:MAG TPA: hypothetical protein VGR89_03990 [Puia sp.]|nr:hypothetical protein [Puia sp.]
MKTGYYSLVYVVLSDGAIVFCFIPSLMLGRKSIRKTAAYSVLGIYWFLNGLDNFLEVFVSSRSGNPALREFSLCNSLIQAPLLLLVYALARQGRSRNALLFLTAIFVGGESILIQEGARGNLLLILGSGAALVILSSVIGLWEYLRKMEHSRFENSMVFIYGALLFYYGSRSIIYFFAHLRRSTAASISDSHLLHCTSLLLAAAVTCAGLWNYRVRKPRAAYWSPPPGYSSSSS